MGNYYISLLPLSLQLTVQNYIHFKGVQKQLVFILGDEVTATNLWLCGAELATLYPHFNYVLTFKITSNGWGGSIQYCKQWTESSWLHSHWLQSHDDSVICWLGNTWVGCEWRPELPKWCLKISELRPMGCVVDLKCSTSLQNLALSLSDL